MTEGLIAALAALENVTFVPGRMRWRVTRRRPQLSSQMATRH